MFSLKSSVWLGVALFLFLILLYSAGYLELPAYNNKMTEAQYVRTENAKFKEGLEFLRADNFKGASLSLEGALSDAKNTNQEAYIKNYLGSALGLDKQYVRSLEVLKSVADNQNYPDINRAGAVQIMGDLYYANGKDSKINEYIFLGLPYASFLKEGDIKKAYERLYEYANSFYPVAGAQYRIALTKFPEIEILNQKTLPTEADKETLYQLWEQVQEAIRRGGDNLVLSKQLDVDGESLSVNMSRQANLLGLATLYGKDHSREAEDLFAEASKLSVGRPGARIWVSYHYALFLSKKFGKSRGEDISKILTPFFELTPETGGGFYKYLSGKEAKSDPEINLDVAHLASVDTKFAELMSSLGWRF